MPIIDPVTSFFEKTCLLFFMAVVTIGSFIGGLWAAVGITLAVLLFFGKWAQKKCVPDIPRRFGLLCVIVLGVFAAEIFGSSNVALSLKTYAHILSFFVPLFLLTVSDLQNISPKRFVFIIPAAACVGACALGFELESGGFLLHMVKKATRSLADYNRGIAHLAILAFPLFCGLWVTRQKQLGALFFVLLLFPACLTESHTAKLALLVGGASSLIAFSCPIFVRKGLAVTSALVLGWPFYVQSVFVTHYDLVQRLPDSWRHRMEIWDYLSYRITERPLLGWGLGTTHTLDFAEPHGGLYKFAIEAAPHAHNFVVQLWVETGMLGLTCGFSFLLFVLLTIKRLHKDLQPFALGAFASALSVAMFGFDFWTDALWASFALSAFVFGMLQQSTKSTYHLLNTEV
jgi:hypothetical protein